MSVKFKAVKQKKLEQLAIDKRRALAVLKTVQADDDQYLEASAKAIVENIKSEKWTATDVVSAYARRALAQDAILNFMTECLITEALTQAKELDSQQIENETTVGPLHGVPFSVKDQFDMEGRDSSVGMSVFCDQPAVSDSTIVQILQRAGAIILFKTNVPQTMNTNECSNPIFGITKNPINPGYTCGGSSGGEAVSLSTSSSALGIGSDIAGSLRYPVHFSGGYSLKPSEHRWPVRGMFELERTSDSPSISAVSGPLGRSVEDVAMLTKIVIDSEPWRMDSKCISIPWRGTSSEKNKKYHFAYYSEDTYTKTSPACSRALLEAIASLEEAGHTCTRIVPPLVAESCKVFVALTSFDGNRSLKNMMRNDPWESNVAMEMYFPPLPRWLRVAAAWFIRKWYKDTQFPALFDVCGSKSAAELCDFTFRRNQIKQSWLDEIWSQNFDGIICPVYPLPAVKHQQTREILPIAVSTFIYNLLDYTVGVVPVTVVKAEDDHNGLNGFQGWKGVFHNIIYEGMFGEPAVYNAKEMVGLNVGVQVVGKNLEEEKVLDMMQVLDDAVKKHKY